MVNIPIRDLLDFIHTYLDSPRIIYPKNHYNYIDLEFKSNLYSNLHAIRKTIDYWGKIPYIGRVGSIYMKNYKTITVIVAEEDSASSDPRKYKPLELLADFIENGTPVRKTVNNTRACEPIADKLVRIEGFSQ
jgi:hypothetical protein